MLEESAGVPSRDRRHRYAQRLDQSFTGAGLGPTQDALDLVEGLFDGADPASRAADRATRNSVV